jgi:O-antigen/teichoic acid export membrane protein
VDQPLLVRLFEKATGTPATKRSAAAVARLGPYLAGMAAAKALSMGGQLLVSRLLGPEEVGRLAVVLSASTLLALPLAGAWGSTFVRYGAAQPEATWRPLLGWVARRTLFSAAAVGLAMILLAPLLASWLQVPAGLIVAGGPLGVAMAAWLLAKAACQGREDWRRFVGSELGFGAATLVLPCLMLVAGDRRWWGATLVFLLAYLIGATPALRLFSPIRRHDDGETIRRAAEYGRFALFTGTASTLFLYSDRFAAQHVLGFAEVGVYQVYSFATVGVAMLLSTLLYNFAFPLFPQGDRRAFAAVFFSAFTRLLPLTLAALFAAGWVQIQLAGFPFRPGLLALATLSGTAFLLAGFYGQLVLSLGVNGSQLAARVAAGTLALYALGVLPAVRLGGLGGLFALYALIYLGVAAFYARALRHLGAESSATQAVAPLVP